MRKWFRMMRNDQTDNLLFAILFMIRRPDISVLAEFSSKADFDEGSARTKRQMFLSLMKVLPESKYQAL